MRVAHACPFARQTRDDQRNSGVCCRSEQAVCPSQPVRLALQYHRRNRDSGASHRAVGASRKRPAAAPSTGSCPSASQAPPRGASCPVRRRQSGSSETRRRPPSHWGRHASAAPASSLAVRAAFMAGSRTYCFSCCPSGTALRRAVHLFGHDGRSPASLAHSARCRRGVERREVLGRTILRNARIQASSGQVRRRALIPRFDP
jgi:hypothetical protein